MQPTIEQDAQRVLDRKYRAKAKKWAASARGREVLRRCQVVIDGRREQAKAATVEAK